MEKAVLRVWGDVRGLGFVMPDEITVSDNKM